MGRIFAHSTLALALYAACGGRSASTTDAAEERAETDALLANCATLAEAICRRREECATPSDSNTRYATEADCRTRTALACSEWSKLPDNALSAETVLSCAETIGAAPCRDISTLYSTSIIDLPYCLPSGTRPDGAACIDDSQCANRYCLGEACGTCITPSAPFDKGAAEGDPCDETTHCQTFLKCEAGTCTQPTCAVPGCLDLGAQCTGINDTAPRTCLLGTHCVGRNDQGSGRCEPYAPDGAECDPYNGPPCQHPALCHRKRCTLPSKATCGTEAPPR